MIIYGDNENLKINFNFPFPLAFLIVEIVKMQMLIIFISLKMDHKSESESWIRNPHDSYSFLNFKILDYWIMYIIFSILLVAPYFIITKHFSQIF